ncbi:MAG: ClpXP protease specificity-enhancing factor [Burkholderiales bacterium]|nr:ClpXP protease specificity-enhancing factor [Burkholderiales bacterium]
MTIPSAPSDQGASTRPYLIRALHDWCTDNGFTPYVAVFVDRTVQVPMEYVKNNEIVLNVGFEATSGLKLGNDTIEFRARFGGQSRDIVVPVDHVVAIYARENGQGMAFPVPSDANVTSPAPLAPADSAARGLRLAHTDAPAPVAAAEPAAEPPTPRAGWSDDEPPEPPSPAPGSRPALKRIK